MKDDDTLAVLCPLEDKALLIEAASHIYFETLHYHEYGWILVRVAAIQPNELAHRLAIAWRIQAPKKPIATLDARRQ